MAKDFLTQLVPPAVGGLDLHHAVDQVNPLQVTRMTNLVRTQEGSVTGRLGLTQAVTASPSSQEPADAVHSIAYLADPRGTLAPGGFTLIVGSGTRLDCGHSGALTLIDTGYSGNPLVMVEARPFIGGDPWLYIADSAKMRKVRADCSDLPIGLSKPVGPERFRIDEFARAADTSINASDRMRFLSVGFDVSGIGPGVAGDLIALAPEKKTTIDAFEIALWTNNAGTGGAPANAIDATDPKEGTNSIRFTAAPGAAPGAYYNFWAKANVKDLDSLGSELATDDDIIHVWLKFDRPDLITEFRIYFVVSAAFSTATLPGTSATLNPDAYVKSFRPSDFVSYDEASSSTIPVVDTANQNLAKLDLLPTVDDTRAGDIEIRRQQRERVRAQSFELASGRNQWTEFGVVGVPLRRGDFRRIGNNTARDWSGVTGIVLAVQVNTNSAVAVNVDDLYLTGGAGLDSSEVGSDPYDYRVINYHPQTGTRSNPTEIQGIAKRLDSLRRGIIVSPKVHGDSEVHQRIYRRGGTLKNNWYFVGENNSDGATFIDTLSDLAIVRAEILQIDNDQPVTTEKPGGNPVYAQPLSAIWGPVSDIMLGCGDPYRPGHLYWSKPEEADHWPAAYNIGVCAPSEELMAGCVYGGQSFVFSRKRMFSTTPNLSNAAIMTVLPTTCAHGLVSPWALTVGAGAIWFASNDGLYKTSGGPETNITDERVRPLFHGEAKNGYLPVDFTHPEAMRLQVYDNELWFQYRDTGGVNQILIFSILFQFWRIYSFTAQPISTITAVNAEAGKTLYIGGRTSGKVWTHAGFSDDGSAITATGRTAAFDQGMPRQDKEYAEIILDADRAGGTITINALSNNDSATVLSDVVTTLGDRQRYYVDFDGGIQARNVSVQFSWIFTTAPPTIFLIGLSYIPQADTTELRVTDWDVQGRLSDKRVKGILFECDTGGFDKQIRLMADGELKTTITVNANGRQVVQVSFAQFEGRILRLYPTDNQTWKLYDFRWIFDEEPIKLTRWETQELDHGAKNEHALLYGYISIRSTTSVTLSITTYLHDGTSTISTYQIASTAGVKRKQFVPFAAVNGVLHKYIFTASAAFWLYREESVVIVQPWGGQQIMAKPFGNDDLDLTRSMRDAGLVASRGGGGG